MKKYGVCMMLCLAWVVSCEAGEYVLTITTDSYGSNDGGTVYKCTGGDGWAEVDVGVSEDLTAVQEWGGESAYISKTFEVLYTWVWEGGGTAPGATIDVTVYECWCSDAEIEGGIDWVPGRTSGDTYAYATADFSADSTCEMSTAANGECDVYDYSVCETSCSGAPSDSCEFYESDADNSYEYIYAEADGEFTEDVEYSRQIPTGTTSFTASFTVHAMAECEIWGYNLSGDAEGRSCADASWDITMTEHK